jgi:UDPglucose--hexose-1-phosphate uridylyltransferase
MSELRRDPVTGRWVIIAAERSRRPSDFAVEERSGGDGVCPFCPGNEAMTPPEIVALRSGEGGADGPGWSVRVVPNRYPAMRVEGPMGRHGLGMFDRMNGIGAHEVIIETPDHARQLAYLDVAEVRSVLQVFAARLRDLRRDPRFRYVLLFKNHGSEAGASLEHSHSQLIATPILPRQVVEELEGAARHYELKERCVYCDLIEQEQADEVRLVCESSAFVVIQPFAARCPFETWILPKRHRSDFDAASPAEIDDLARVLRETLTRLGSALRNPAYNFIVHSGPLQEPELAHYHWHLEIMPKLTQVAGFEWGSGFFINPTAPEEAAAYLRAISLGEEPC